MTETVSAKPLSELNVWSTAIASSAMDHAVAALLVALKLAALAFLEEVAGALPAVPSAPGAASVRVWQIASR